LSKTRKLNKEEKRRGEMKNRTKEEKRMVGSTEVDGKTVVATKLEEIFQEVKSKDVTVVRERFEKIRDKALTFWKNDESMVDLTNKDFEDSMAVVEAIYQNPTHATDLYWKLDTAVREITSSTLHNLVSEELHTPYFRVKEEGEIIRVLTPQHKQVLWLQKDQIDEFIQTLTEAKENFVR
jgi:hypothetical protein